MSRYYQLQAALKMFRGDHSWSWNSAGQPVPRNIPTNLRSWSVINLYQQIQRTVVANLMKGDLIGQVYPKNASPEARERAKITQALLEYYIKRSGYTEALAESIHWGLVAGDAFLKVTWDPNGDSVVNNGKAERHGAIRVTAPCPQSIIVDETAIDLEDSPWLIHEVIMSRERIKAQFPKLKVQLQEDAQGAEYSIGALVQTGIAKARMWNQSKKGVRVIEYWERPSEKNPGGIFCVIANDEYLVEPQAWPFPRLPFVHWKVEIDPGQFTGRSFMWDLIPIQKAMNSSFSSILDYIIKLPRPALTAAKGSIVTGRIEQHTGREIIEYNPKLGRPTQLPPTQLEAWVQNFIKDMSNMMDLVSGIGAPVQGRAPFAQATGRAMAFLIEMDQVKMGPMARRVGEAVVGVSKLMLEIARQFQQEPVIVRMKNLDGHYDYREFKQEDLEYGEIDIDVGAITSTSQAVLQDTVNQWVHLGIMDPQEARRLLSLGPRSWEDLDPYAQDRAWAKMNIGRLLESQDPIVKEYMAWPVHEEVLTEFMKSKQYLTDTPSWIQTKFESFLAYLRQQAQANIQAQQAMQAPPGGPGGGPTAPPGNQGTGGGPGKTPGMPGMQGQVLNTPQGGNPQEEQALQGAIGGANG